MELTTKYRRILSLVLGAGVFLLGLKYGPAPGSAISPGHWHRSGFDPADSADSAAVFPAPGISAALSVTGMLLVLGLALWLLTRLLLRQLSGLYDRLPELMASASQGLSAFGYWAQHLADLLPGGVGDAFSDWAQTIVRSGGTLASPCMKSCFPWSMASWQNCRIRCCLC